MKESYVVGAPMPKSIGLCADLYKEIQDIRLAMQKAVDEVQAREREIREHIINNLSKSDDTGAAGKKYRAQITTKPVPTLQNWDEFTEFIRKNRRFDLLHKRVAEGPVKAMWEEGEAVPGIGRFNKVDVSITKI